MKMKNNKDKNKNRTNKKDKEDKPTDKVIDAILEILGKPKRDDEIVNELKIKYNISYSKKTVKRKLDYLIKPKMVRLVNKKNERKYYKIYNFDRRNKYYIRTSKSYAQEIREKFFEQIKNISNVIERYGYLRILLTGEPNLVYSPTFNERVKSILEIWDANITKEDFVTYYIYYLNKKLPDELATDFNLILELAFRLTIYLEYMELVILFKSLQSNNDEWEKELNKESNKDRINEMEWDYEFRNKLVNHIENKLEYYLTQLKELPSQELSETKLKLPDPFSEIGNSDQAVLSIYAIVECLKILVIEEKDIRPYLEEISDIITEDKNRPIAYNFLEYINKQKPECLRTFFDNFTYILFKKIEVLVNDTYFRSLLNELSNWALENPNQEKK